jgi:hypothetical protein
LKKRKLSQPVQQQKNAVYICGDSFSYVSPETDMRIHWSSLLKHQLARILPGVKVHNIAIPSCTNFTISLQIEKALSDPATFFIIVNGTEIFKTLLPTRGYRRVSKHFWKYKGILDESYQAMLHEPFLHDTMVNGMFLGNELLDQIGRPYLPEYYAEKKLYETMGPVSLYFENKSRRKENSHWGPRFSDEIYEYAKQFFELEFDINIRWNQDFSLLEGKFYKTIAKGVGLVFSLGGLTEEKILRLNKDCAKMISAELEPYQTDINFWYLQRPDFHQAPSFHINNPKDHANIATEYFERIQSHLNKESYASSATTG